MSTIGRSGAFGKEIVTLPRTVEWQWAFVCQALPITIPVTNTRTPPSTTWNAARRNGVSM